MKTYQHQNILCLLLSGFLTAINISHANAQAKPHHNETSPKLLSVKNEGSSLATYNKKLQVANLLFTENRGQVANRKGRRRPDILFTAHSAGISIYLTATGIHYQFGRTTFPAGYEQDERQVKDPAKQAGLRQKIKTTTHRLSVSLQGANPSPRIRKEQKSSYTENFYLANCPNGITDVSTYERVVMEAVYPGIDWVVYSQGQHLEYDFVVHPNADPSVIKLKVRAADAVSISDDGTLLMKTSLGEVREAQPVSYCGDVKVKSSFMKGADGTISFRLGDWDRSETLVIDPSVGWGTYYGGTGWDVGYYCATDGSGNVYLAGSTETSGGTVIATSGSHQASYGGGTYDAFLVKFNSSGVRQWGTFYGGSLDDLGGSCATDGSGNVYLSGVTTTSTGTAIATSGSHQTSFGGLGDAFLVKFNSSGVRQWGTYYGGSGDEYGRFCATDASGNVYLTGNSSTSGGMAIATSGSHQPSYGGGVYNAFLVKFNSSGVRQWGTYYGGGGEDYGHACTTDGSGNVYIAGQTRTMGGTAIATSGSHQASPGGGYDAFLVKFNSGGVRQWGTYYGGTAVDYGFSCATDGSGNVYIAGSTNGSGGTSIATPGSHQASFGGSNYDGFLAKFNSSGVRQWGSYYGGNGDDWGYSCVTDGSGNVYLTGRSSTSIDTAIATSGSHQASYGGGSDDAFLVQFNSSGVRQWGSYYGGSDYEISYSCATDGPGNIYIAGHTSTSGGTAIATSGSHQPGYGGGSFDAFLAKFVNPPVNTQCIPPPSGLVAWWPGDGNANDIQGTNHGAFHNGATTAPGLVGQAFSFNHVNDYVLTPASTVYPYGNSARTVQVWVYTQNLASWGSEQTIFEHGDQPGVRTSFGIDMDGYEHIQFYSWGDDLNHIYTGPKPVVGWMHIAITYDGFNLLVYVDGVLRGSRTYPNGLNTTQSDAVVIGRSNNLCELGIGGDCSVAANTSFRGLIDEVQIYNRALLQSEIQGIYNAGSAGVCKSPTITCPADKNANCGESTAPSNTGTATASGGCGGTSITFSDVTTPGSCSGIYTIMRTWTATDVCNNSSTCTQTIIVNPPVNTQCIPAPSGLVAWWPGDGNANDIQGTNLGTLQNGATTAPGLISQAFSLNGSTSNSYVSTPVSSVYPSGNNPRTVQMWVYTRDLSSWEHERVIFEHGEPTVRGAFGIVMNPFPNIQFYAWADDLYPINTGRTLPVGWMHVAVTYDGLNLLVYVDGALKASRTYPQGLNTPLSDAVAIGRSNNLFECCNTMTSSFYGLIDEVQIYNRALLQSEIHGIYNAGSVGVCKSICSGSSISFSAPNVTGNTYQWQVDTTGTGTNYLNLANDTTYSGVTASVLTLTTPPTLYYGYMYRCLINGGSAQTPPQTLRFSDTWTGGQDTAWENPTNWSCNGIPDGFTDVIIPSNSSLLPVISSNAACRSLWLKPGITLTVMTGYSLDIKGK